MSKGESIVKWIKWQRIRWLGHLERMEEDRMPKKIFTQELEGTRRRGRPKKRWKEEVERYLQMLGVRRWRELVADRKKWTDIVRQAKAHSGLSANGRRRMYLTGYIIMVSICTTCLSFKRTRLYPHTKPPHVHTVHVGTAHRISVFEHLAPG